MGNIFLIFLALLLLELQLVQTLLRRGHRAGIVAAGNDIVLLHDLLCVGAQQGAEIVVVDAAGGIGISAVEVNQCLEAVFLAAVEHPVDGPLLVDFAVIRKEILQKVVADDLTACVALVA